MSSFPKISVVIPVHNTEKYLEECLLSVQNQTLRDFEAIIVNDKTLDNSMAVAKKFSVIDSRFSVVEHDVNKGLGGARNTGIDSAKGQYLFFLDSDDAIPLDALELLWNASMSGTHDMVIGNMAWRRQHYLYPINYIDNRLQTWKTLPVRNLRNLSASEVFIGSIVNRLYKRDVFLKNQIRFPEKLYFEDLLVSVEVWYCSNTICSFDNIVYFRTERQDPNNLSITQTYNQKSYYDRDQIAELIYFFSANNPSSKWLGIEALHRLLGTSKDMLSKVPQDLKKEIVIIWFPKHILRISRLINSLKNT